MEELLVPNPNHTGPESLQPNPSSPALNESDGHGPKVQPQLPLHQLSIPTP